jgi:hypothetical protein
MDGYTPPPDRPIDPPMPVLPLEALASVDSPQSIEQSLRLGLAPGAAAAARPVAIRRGFLLTSERGTAYVFAGGKRQVLPVLPGATRLPDGRLLVGFVNVRDETAAAESREGR